MFDLFYRDVIAPTDRGQGIAFFNPVMDAFNLTVAFFPACTGGALFGAGLAYLKGQALAGAHL